MSHAPPPPPLNDNSPLGGGGAIMSPGRGGSGGILRKTFIQEALSRTSDTNDFLFGSGTGGPDGKNEQFDKAMLQL